MNLLSNKLLVFVIDTISPQKSSHREISSEEYRGWMDFLNNESESIKIEFFRSLDISDQGIFLYKQLVSMNDIVNGYLLRRKNIWKNHPQANLIRGVYLNTIDSIEELIHLLTVYDQNYAYHQLKISDFRLAKERIELKVYYKAVLNKISALTISIEIQAVLLNGLFQYIHKKALTQKDIIYLKGLMNVLLKEDDLDNLKLQNLLIVTDFGLPEFFLYYVSSLQKMLLECPGTHDKRKILLTEQDNIYHLSLYRGLQMPGSTYPLHLEISRYLDEKYKLIQLMTNLKREILEDSEKEKPCVRVRVNLPVAQFALLIRLFMERGLLMKEHVGEQFVFFATYFFTPNTSDISADSLQKKSTDVEFGTALKLKGHLIQMLNWLNENFNLSNYKNL